MGMSGRIARLAAEQGGFISRAQLLELGVSLGALHRKIAARDLTLISEGIYQVFEPATHLDLMRGAVLALPDATVSHESAAHLLELPYLPQLVPTVTVASHTTHRFPGVLVRRNNDLHASHLIEVNGLVVTNVARTLFDLAAILKYREFVRTAESAILDGRTHLDHLESLLTKLARRGKPGVRTTRDFVETRSGIADASVLERKGREVIAQAGIPAPLPEFPMPWNPRRRFDDAYPQAKLAIEWDSRGWHAQQDAMTTDRRRDREAAAHGWLVVRFTWNDVTQHPEEVVATVSTLLKQRGAA